MRTTSGRYRATASGPRRRRRLAGESRPSAPRSTMVSAARTRGSSSTTRTRTSGVVGAVTGLLRRPGQPDVQPEAVVDHAVLGVAAGQAGPFGQADQPDPCAGHRRQRRAVRADHQACRTQGVADLQHSPSPARPDTPPDPAARRACARWSGPPGDAVGRPPGGGGTGPSPGRPRRDGDPRRAGLLEEGVERGKGRLRPGGDVPWRRRAGRVAQDPDDLAQVHQGAVGVLADHPGRGATSRARRPRGTPAHPRACSPARSGGRGRRASRARSGCARPAGRPPPSAAARPRRARPAPAARRAAAAGRG